MQPQNATADPHRDEGEALGVPLNNREYGLSEVVMTIEERIEFLMQSIESHDRQIGDITDAINKLVAVTNQDATAIRTLARIADAHGQRSQDIEGRSQEDN